MAKKKNDPLLGEGMGKIQPKLRMITKGNTLVNTVRADFASSVRVRGAAARMRTMKTMIAEPSREIGSVEKKKLKAPRLKEVSDAIEASVFVTRYPQSAEESIDGLADEHRSVDGRLSTAKVNLDQLAEIAEEESVAYIELGDPIKEPDAAVTNSRVRAPSASLRNIPGRDSGARNVLVGILDVGGIDFSHEDFLNADGSTRWVSIWDQGGTVRTPPGGFDYGSEITKEHMDAAIENAGSVGLPAWALEVQSQTTTGSHGTHVASIAAGNRGVARNAYLAGVLITLPSEITQDRRKSFYDSTRIAHGIDYLYKLAEKIRVEEGLDELPVSINISLGTNGGGHDASSAVSRWIDNELAVPGRCVCVAAGNSGQEKPEKEGDVGFVMGRIHTSGRIEARGLNNDIEMFVAGNGLVDLSENELEIWYSGSDRFAVTVTPPGMDPIGPVYPQEFYQNEKLSDGSFLSIYNELYHPANGANYIAVYLSPFLKENPIVGVRAGLWKIRLHGVEVRDGRYHGWIERDDPRPLGAHGEKEYWNFPSFFSERSNIDDSSVSSLACGQRVVSVANLDSLNERMNISSSQGPTRDGRLKPDVAANGTNVVAANGFAGDDESRWISMTGTSMASPYVTGIAALMLAAEPRLTAAQICGIIQRTSQPLPGKNYEWANDCGYGVINPEACVLEAKNLSSRKKLNP